MTHKFTQFSRFKKTRHDKWIARNSPVDDEVATDDSNGRVANNKRPESLRKSCYPTIRAFWTSRTFVSCKNSTFRLASSKDDVPSLSVKLLLNIFRVRVFFTFLSPPFFSFSCSEQVAQSKNVFHSCYFYLVSLLFSKYMNNMSIVRCKSNPK